MYSKMPTKPKICIFFGFELPTINDTQCNQINRQYNWKSSIDRHCTLNFDSTCIVAEFRRGSQSLCQAMTGNHDKTLQLYKSSRNLKYNVCQ